jgi:prepilin-type N-terminal cleavage/methylation domain-containing protein
MMRRVRGWTLIELIVVIAIILVLAGMVYAIGAYAVESSRQAHCISNLRQIGIALKQYIDDYKQADWETEIGGLSEEAIRRMDRETSEQLVSRWGFPYSLRDLVRGGYLKDARLLRCPSASGPSAKHPVHYSYPRPIVVRDNVQGIPVEYNGLLSLKRRTLEYSIVVDDNHSKMQNDRLGPFIMLRMSGTIDRGYVSLSELRSKRSTGGDQQ